MTPDLLDRLGPFRAEALRRGIPAADVERWIGTARPCATLAPSGDGPVAGRFGGPLLLPPGAPNPAHPLVASIDCAALPEDARTSRCRPTASYCCSPCPMRCTGVK